MTDRAPLVIAHRGGAESTPENSAAAFEHALTLGVDMLECDVRQTADGVLVLLHDAEIRDGDRRRSVAETSYATVTRILPWTLTLDEYFEQFGHRAPVNVDVKAYGFEHEVVKAIQRHGLVGDGLISSTHTGSLRAMRDQEPRLTLGLSRGHFATRAPAAFTAAWLRLRASRLLLPMIALARADAIMLHYRVVTPDIVRRIHQSGYRVFTWTVDDGRTAERLASAGVDGIASNRPASILNARRPPGARTRPLAWQ